MNAGRHARIKALFLEACALPADERARFVAGACGADADLRAAVSELLANDEHPLAAIEEAGRGGGATFLAHGLAREGGLGAQGVHAELPARIGRYRIMRVLGEGGMGIVYEAEQETPKRRVAVKVVRAGMASPRLLRRFEHEAQLLGRLNHPGIAHVYEAGTEDASGTSRPFCALELVEGDSLIEDARRRKLDVRERLETFVRVCDAVEHAHQHGVLHRDLKPGNILVDRSHQPKVLDFGVARLLDADAAVTTRLTAEGSVIGTLAYMSPEQVSGDADGLDARSDIYSLGVIAYELLSGRLPYDLLDAPIPQAARTICEVEAVPLGNLDRALRGDLQTIFATALSKDRQRRYASAGEMAADIRRFLRDEPIVARPTSTLYQLSKFARRNKALVAGASVAAAALVAGTITSTWLAHSESRERRRADVNAAEAGRQAYRGSVLAAGLALDHGSPGYARQLLTALDERLTGFEFRRLKRLTGQWLREVDPKVGYPWLVAFEPGARTVVAVGSHGAVATVDLETGAVVARLADAKTRNAPRALSRDGALCVSVPDGTPVVWSTITGETLRTLDLHADLHVADRNTAAFAPDARRFAVSSNDRGVFVFDLGADAAPVHLETHRNGLGLVEFSADGSRIATTCGGIPEVSDSATGKNVARFPRVADAKSLAIDARGRRVAVGAGEDVHFLDVESGREVRVLADHPDIVTSLAFSPDDALLAAEMEEGSVWLWDCASGALLDKAWVGRASWRTSMAWSADGRRFVTGAHVARRVRVWDAEQARDHEVLRGHTKAVYPVRYTHDGARIVSAGWDKTVRIWSADTNQELAVLRGHREWIVDLAISPDDAFIASVSHDEQLIVWSARTGARVANAATGRPWRSVAWSPDGTSIAAGEADAPFEVVLFDATTLAPRRTFAAFSNSVNTLAFDPTGARLAAGSQDGSARVYDVARGAIVAARKGLGYVYSARWSPDGKSVALSGNRFLEIDDASALLPVRKLDAHPREVFAATFSPDGDRLFSGGRDGRLLVWDVESGALVGQFEGPDSYIWSVAASADGTRVATGSGNCEVRQWESQPVSVTCERRESARRLAAEAASKLEPLFQDLGDAEQVADRVACDPTLSASEREAAFECILLRSAGSTSPPEVEGLPR